jgi:hypothetical protein
MVTIELSETEGALLRDMIEVQARELQHEMHHTDDRGFRQLLRQKEALLEHLLQQLPPPTPAP